MGKPVAMQVYQSPTETIFLTSKDWDQARIILLTFIVIGLWKLVGWMTVFIKQMIFGKVQKTDEKIDTMYDAIQRLEAKFDTNLKHQEHIEKKIVPKDEIHTLVRKEIDYYHRLKGER